MDKSIKLPKYDRSIFTIDPSLDEKYKTITFGPELQKKHDDLMATLDRVRAKQGAKTSAL
jgi:hypothetical protein